MGQFGALGDIHGDFDSVRRIQQKHPDIPFWLCVGDVADAAGRYEPFGAPVYWIKGNNENFDAIAAGVLPGNLHYLPNAQLQEIDGLCVAGLGGTFAPTWYDTPAAALPHPHKSTAKATELADKRRHFVRDEVVACQALRNVDVLLTHEAPRPFYAGGAGSKRGIDAGKTPINEILAAMKPHLHLFGHHHRFSEQERHGVQSVGLDLVSRSYLLIDGKTLKYTYLQP
jgi:Icc-related predicted phosphoesterase